MNSLVCLDTDRDSHVTSNGDMIIGGEVNRGERCRKRRGMSAHEFIGGGVVRVWENGWSVKVVGGLVWECACYTDIIVLHKLDM